MALLEVKNIYKSFGGVKAIQDFSLAADAGQIHASSVPTARARRHCSQLTAQMPVDAGTVTYGGALCGE